MYMLYSNLFGFFFVFISKNIEGGSEYGGRNGCLQQVPRPGPGIGSQVASGDEQCAYRAGHFSQSTGQPHED